MANKSGMKPGQSGSESRGSRELGSALLAIVGVGVAGSIALVSGAVKLGEKVLDLQVKAYEKIESEREAQKKAVREIAEAEMEFASEPRNEELQPESDEEQ